MNIILLKQMHKILSYNEWANKRLIGNLDKIEDCDFIKPLSISFGNINGLLHHLSYFDTKYYYKIVEKSLEPKIEKNLSKALLTESILLYSKKWLVWIEDLIDNATAIDQIEVIAKQIIDLNTHNTYHRGQINIIISILGYKPESLDIFLYNNSTS